MSNLTYDYQIFRNAKNKMKNNNKILQGIDILFDQWTIYQWNEFTVHFSLCVFCIHFELEHFTFNRILIAYADSDVFKLNGVLDISKWIVHVPVRMYGQLKLEVNPRIRTFKYHKHSFLSELRAASKENPLNSLLILNFLNCFFNQSETLSTFTHTHTHAETSFHSDNKLNWHIEYNVQFCT